MGGVCVCAGGFLLFLESISYLFIKYMSGKYLSNKCHKYMYVLKKDGRPESAKHWKNVYIYIYESCLINCDLANPSTPIGGVHQRFLSPDILTTGGCIKKKYMTHCWECPHKKRVWNIFGSVPIRVGWVWGNVNGTMSAITGV